MVRFTACVLRAVLLLVAPAVCCLLLQLTGVKASEYDRY